MATIIIGDNIFENVSLAVTSEEQNRGLMGKPYPPPLLLFPYKKASIKKFWMKDTPSPLDIIFCNANCVIYIGKGEPFNENLIGPNEKSNLVLEAPHGFVDYYNISVGDKIRVRYNKVEIENVIKNGSPKLENNAEKDKNK